jgi:hypothetical protein
MPLTCGFTTTMRAVSNPAGGTTYDKPEQGLTSQNASLADCHPLT